jgi:hypothetical protein
VLAFVCEGGIVYCVRSAGVSDFQGRTSILTHLSIALECVFHILHRLI